MQPTITVFPVLLLATLVVSQPHDGLVSTITTRQTSSPPRNCNATCNAFTAAKKACSGIQNCGCTDKFLQAQGDCLVCQADDIGDAAAVQYTVLDAEINQCHIDGIPIEFQVQLPPGAQAIVDDVHRQSASLRSQQTAFLALQIAGGHIGLVIVLLLAVFSRKVRRDPTFLNFCITWIFSSVVYSILLYRGTEGNSIMNSLGRVPPSTCLAQAALINGAQVMTACSTMALVIQLWIGLRTAINGDPLSGPRQKQWATFMLLVSPYILFFAFAIPSVFVGRHHITFGKTSIERVLPTNFYCSVVELSSFLRAVYGVTLGLLLVTAVFDGMIIAVLYRHWRTFRHVQTKSAISLSILLRVMLFSLYRVVVAVAYGTVLNDPPQVIQSGSGDTLSVAFGVPTWVDMLQAAIPLVGFLVLGVNNDMFASLIFWRRNKRAVSTMQSINTTTNTYTATTVDISNNQTWNDKAILDADTKHVAP